MNILLSGYSGFVGSYLSSLPNVVLLKDKLGNRVDINDKQAIKTAIDQLSFDAVIHLAAQSFVPLSFEDPSKTFQTNFFGTLNFLEALSEANFKGRFLYVGSSDCYGPVNEKDLPIKEILPLNPQNPYSASKTAAEALCLDLSKTAPFEIIATRPFNHIGAGQDERFAVSNFAKQVIEVKLGIKKPLIEVGDLKVSRDFLDVQDVIDAYLLILKHGRNGQVYNICSSVERTLESVLDELLLLKNIKAEIGVINGRLRGKEQARVCGSFEKLNKDTSWYPQIPFETTLNSILDYWESKILCPSML
jgi:GDP-4-dehydro-6-deoxy-D-mannose reductase